MKFHITPSGQARTCSAQPGHCHYGENGVDPEHYSTKEKAQTAYENLQKNNILPVLRVSKKNELVIPTIMNEIVEYPDNWISHDLSDEKFNQEHYKSIINHYDSPKNRKVEDLKEMSREELNDLLFFVSLSGNGMKEVNMNIYSPENESAFTRGGCLLLAYEIHHQTGLPIVAIGTQDHWQGHAGILYKGELIDIDGPSSIDDAQDYLTRTSVLSKKELFVEEIKSKEEFYNKFNNGSNVFWHNDKFGQAVVARLAQKVCEDYLGLKTKP